MSKPSFAPRAARGVPFGERFIPDAHEPPGDEGRTTSGISKGGYSSGISLGDGSFFGRRAGRYAASEPEASEVIRATRRR